MKIVQDKPPNFPALRAFFGPVIERKGVIFTYGDTIYNPFPSGAIPRWIIFHEAVHSQRQGSKAAEWWGHYLEEKAFRFNEELIAHQMEYHAFCKEPGIRRFNRRQALHEIASRLSGPLYGNLVGYETAVKRIKHPERIP